MSEIKVKTITTIITSEHSNADCGTYCHHICDGPYCSLFRKDLVAGENERITRCEECFQVEEVSK